MDAHAVQAVWLPRWVAMRDALDPLGDSLGDSLGGGGPPRGRTAPSLPDTA